MKQASWWTRPGTESWLQPGGQIPAPGAASSFHCLGGASELWGVTVRNGSGTLLALWLPPQAAELCLLQAGEGIPSKGVHLTLAKH